MKDTHNLFSRLLEHFSKQDGLEKLLVMSGHWNGYKREKAVSQLGSLGDPLALPCLIVRVNDWVPQVRIAAKGALLKLAVPENIDAFVLALPELYHLKNCNRGDHAPFISSIEEYLLSSENTGCLIDGIKNKEALIVRACVSLIIENNLMPTAEIVKVGLAHPDLIVRVKVSYLLKILSTDAQASALTIALKDRFMPVRREAFLVLLKTGVSDLKVQVFLFDRHPAIREIAIGYFVNKRGDVRKIYQEHLSSSPAFMVRYALWGLGKCKNINDVAIVKTFLISAYPSIRKQSLSTLVALVNEKAVNEVIKSLSDESPAVCKEAARLSNKYRFRFTAEKLLEIINSSESRHALSCCIAISRTINKWERLIFLMSLFDDKYVNNLIESAQVNMAIMQWDLDFNRNLAQPDKLQLETIHCKLNKINQRMSSEAYRNVVFTLKSYEVSGHY